MKFVKEIISRKQDRAGSTNNPARPAEALDLKAFSLERPVTPGPVRDARPQTAEATPDIATGDAATGRPTAPQPSRAPQHSSEADAPRGRPATAHPGLNDISGGHGAEMADVPEAAPDARFETPPAPSGSERPLTAVRAFRRNAARRAEATPETACAPTAPDTEPDPQSDPRPPQAQSLGPDMADIRPAADPDPALTRDEPGPAPVDAPDAPGAGRADDPVPPTGAAERPVAAADPFARLDRIAGDPPAPGAPSPFHRDGTARATSQRPRTRLSENLSAQTAYPNSPAQSDLHDQAAVRPIDMPAPAAGRAARRAGRVKTRLLGFGASDAMPNPFDAAGRPEPGAGQAMFPVGWIVVVSGPGRGNAFTLFAGVSQIGRGEDQAVRLDFGDTSISRSNHAAVAYDPQQQKFYLGHGGKANLVRLNGKPVLSTEEMPSGSVIEIGETRLRFVALCGDAFDWDKCGDEDIETAIFG